MKSHLLAAAFSLLLLPLSQLSPLAAVQATEDPPDDPSLAKDQAKAVSETVKHDAKAVADAAKKGAKQVAATAKEVAHQVAAASKEGAQKVAATAKKGAEKTKAAVNGEKGANPPPRSPSPQSSPPRKPPDSKPTGRTAPTPDKTPAS